MILNAQKVSIHGNAGIRGSQEYIEVCLWLYQQSKRSVTQIAKVFNCHHSTISRLLKENGVLALYNNKAKGEKSGLWKGGITKTAKYIRLTPKYKLWRRGVFGRDNYTCQKCKKINCYLIAHHIKEQCNYPELIFDIDNGLTLCRECHKQTDNYGGKAKKYKLDYLGGE